MTHQDELPMDEYWDNENYISEELPSDSEPMKTVQVNFGPGRVTVPLQQSIDNGTVRTFVTGATRGTTEGKLDYEGCLSPLVLERYAQYMLDCSKMPDGSVRANDNWQKGIPLKVYMKSAWRHFMDLWYWHRRKCYDIAGEKIRKEHMETILCALMFNTMGYLHELLKDK